MSSRRKMDDAEALKVKVSRDSIKQAFEIFTYLKPYIWKFVGGLFFITLSALSTLFFPFLIGKMISVATGTNALPGQVSGIENLLGINGIHWTPILILQLIFVQLGFQMLFSYMRIYLLTETGEKSLADLRTDVFDRIIHMPMSFFNEHRVGELTSRVSSDLGLIQDTITLTLAEFLRGIVTLLAGLILIFTISVKLALVMLSVVPVIAVLAVVFGIRIRKMSRKAQDHLAETGTILNESLQAITNVKAFTGEKSEVLRYSTSMKNVVGSAIANARFRGAFVSLLIFSVFGAIAIVIWYGVSLIGKNGFDQGSLTQFVIYTAFVGGTIAGFADMFSQIQKTLGATQRVWEILKGEIESDLDTVTSPGTALRGELTFERVAFSYPNRKDIQVLKDISFKVETGKKLAVVGPSGAGKSTIASLILRFFSIESGYIYIDGVSTSNYPLKWLRSQIAIVPQEVILFGGSIYDNIIYGKPQATKEEVESAARSANAHEFIMGFPEQYNTRVGERGVQLSGGQRQRIAIARAILKNPRILILDEATSSLDSESEASVQQALEKLMEGRTSVIIAHRLSTIRYVDDIIVIDKGNVAEKGTHDELMEKNNGIYKKMVEMQNEFTGI